MFPRPSAPQLALAAALLPGLAAAQQTAGAHQARDIHPPFEDCNFNGIRDTIDLNNGTSLDCNANLVPDECDVGQLTLLSESFESGLPEGWSTYSLAHVTDQCARPTECDGSNFVYFGVDDLCTFEDGFFPEGGLNLPPIDIPAAALSVELTFCSAYEGEGVDPYDAADVFVNGVLVEHVSPNPQLEWETRTIGLTYLAGETASISFNFLAMDGVGNAFLGWQVDNIRITAFGVGEPGLDCNQNGVPDECDTDCNLNGTPDDCDIAAGTELDCNLNGVPDACDLAALTSADCNLNAIPDECDLTLDLHAALANLETSHTVITSFFPDTQDFPGGDDGTCIEFDFLGTFDCASTLNTNLASEVPYTGSTAVPGAGFGPGAKYFTAKHPGLFTMVATGCSVDSFAIGGNNGAAAGNGTVDGFELSINVGIQPYSIYLKRVYDTSAVSVNQIIAIPGDGTGVTHGFPGDPLMSEQTLDGLGGIDRIFYALVCRRILGETSPPLRPVDAREIMRELISGSPGPASTDSDDNGVPDECD